MLLTADCPRLPDLESRALRLRVSFPDCQGKVLARHDPKAVAVSRVGRERARRTSWGVGSWKGLP
jgi:hypothetical protein